MFIKSIKLKNFKKFSGDEGSEIKFPADLTVVRAANESGKSTIVSAVTAGLFLNPKTAKIKLFQSWQSDRLPEIAVTFEEKGETYELAKNFNLKEASLENLDTKEKITNFEQIQKMIKEIFGFAESDVFESVFSVNQDAFYRLSEHKSTLQESLENLVTGGGRTVSDAVISLDKEMTAITRQGLKNPGHLQRTKGELMRIDEFFADFNAKSAKFRDLTENLSVKASDLEKIEHKYEAQKQKLQLSMETVNFKKELNLIDENLEKLEEASMDIGRIREQMKNFKEFKEINIEKLKETVKELARKVNFKRWSEESVLSGFVRMNYNFLKYFFGGLAVISLATSFFYAFSMVLFAVFAVLLIMLAVLNKKISASYQLMQSARDLDTILKKFNTKTLESLYQKINEFGTLALEEAKINHFFSRLGGEKAFSKQKDDRKSILRSLDTIHLRAEEKRINIEENEQELKRIKRETDVLEKNREDLKGDIAKIQGELKGMNFAGDDEIRMEEMRESFGEQLDYWQKKLKILEAAKELLLAARAKTLSGIKDKLSDYISQFLILISGGKYKKISFDDDLVFKVYSGEKGSDIVPEDDLSRGAIDQFYLVVRFAFAKILARGGKSFMILDDPFHNFDAERKSYAKKLLQDLSADFQIILFTHSDEYDGWGQMTRL